MQFKYLNSIRFIFVAENLYVFVEYSFNIIYWYLFTFSSNAVFTVYNIFETNDIY